MARAKNDAAPVIDPAYTVAGDVWRQMAEFTWSRMQRGQAFHVLKTLGLTPGHLKVLAALQPDEALPMGTIAEMLPCDPSMATWLIDRLEDRKLVERRMLSTDRRVKVVRLTRRGVSVKTKVLAHLFEPPPELLMLDLERLEALRGALSALPRPERPFRAGAGRTAVQGRHRG
jgi:MarR family transcriptional regulator, organic hydroperoxide resistance regulator